MPLKKSTDQPTFIEQYPLVTLYLEWLFNLVLGDQLIKIKVG